MFQRIISDPKVRSSGWGFLIAIIIAAGGGVIGDDTAGKIGEHLIYTLPTVLSGIWLGWRAKAKALPPAPGNGADHG